MIVLLMIKSLVIQVPSRVITLRAPASSPIMANKSVLQLSIPAIHQLIKQRKLSIVELCQETLQQINQHEDQVKAFITQIPAEQLLTAARDLDANLDPEQLNLLYGIPISVKDTFTTQGVRTTAASKILADFIPPYDATAYRRLKDQRSLLIGKTNMDEFAHGFTTEYSAFYPTKNPWNLKMIPGGSSGGSAASVAYRSSLLSLASENFGSIIQPAALCGVVGMKPTYGRASRFGIIAMASSLESPGIIGRCVEDVAIGISAISGHDSQDATSLALASIDLYANLATKPRQCRIAIIRPILEQLDHTVVSQFMKGIDLLRQFGCTIDEIDWYDLELDGQIYDILYRAEVASNLARYDGIRYGYRDQTDSSELHDYYIKSRSVFGKHVKRQILSDPVTLSQDENDLYHHALRLRRQNRDYIDALFEQYDVIATPATTFLKLEINQAADTKWREQNRHLAKINAAMICPTVLYGYPAITFPIQLHQGIPVGVNMYSARLHEQTLLDTAYHYQEKSGLKWLSPI